MLCSQGTAQVQLAHIDGEDQGATVSRLYGEVVIGGYLPLRVRLENKTDRPQQWGLRARSSIDDHRSSVIEFSKQFEVGARTAEVFDVLVPTPSIADFEQFRNTGYYYGYSSMQVTGTLVGPEQDLSFSCYSSGNTDIDSILLTNNVVDIVGYGEQVIPFIPQDFFNDGTRYVPPGERLGFQLVQLEANTMQEDWRAYWGFGMILLSTEEWKSLSSLQTQALMNWVRAGGVLVLPDWNWARGNIIPGVSQDDFKSGECHYGLGRIEVGPIVGGYESVNRRVFDEGAFPLSNPRVSGVFGYDLQDRESLGGYYAVLIGFIVLVGPVNLMYFCRGRRRYRLFVTTPLIVLASLSAIALYSLLRDGVGGEGERFELTLFGGDSNQALRVQSQGADLGMIFGRSFEVPDKAHVERFSVPGAAQKRYEVDGSKRSGDWFVSRSKNSLLVAWAEPSREQVRLEVNGNGAGLKVSSRIKGTVTPFVLKDGAGNYWTTESLSLGETKSLTRVDAEKVKDLIERLTQSKARRLYETAIERQLRGSNVFFGELKNDANPALATLKSVAWDDGGHLALGQVVLAGRENQ
ncbi:hypothetical protein IEN85_05070 [Pelagicoccus sp. NFK12]|uniref:Uncharacterized protein n=1 Tax=Pelagicoccus enzymogenes TaxID=2773457 RepID=A0A927F5N0_9BACT|nr:hypothetical protein [Pelagicoccus enzymogenes]MBD5778853.1 hypothetical protein [Pelagicoccus enzymogenes]